MNEEADALYALPLEQFVPERTLLAKALRAEGDRDGAATVAKLAKPSLAAWAVNQVVRTQPGLASELWSAGDEVLAAQRRAVSGEGTGAELREALQRERKALDPLADAARGLITGNGKFLGEANVQAVIETLHAAAVDPAVREEVAAGRAVRQLRLSGLEALAGGPVAPKEREAATKRAELAERDREDTEREREQRAASSEERKRRTEQQRALARAERTRDAARKRVADAAAAREAAARHEEAMRAQLEAAQLDLTKAEEERRAAHDALERAEDDVSAARADLDG